MDEDILAVVEASAIRRWLGVLMLAGLGGLMIYIALASSPGAIWQMVLIVIGALALWMAEQMRRATQFRIELTEQELRSSDGHVIARIEDIEGVDRSVLAFKPSNGFLVRLRKPGQRTWRPGLWWCSGRRVGVGGVTSASQAKAMSDVILTILATRGQDIP